MVLRTRVVALTCLAALLGVTGASAVAAHEQRPTAGVELTVGWAEEPAFVGFRNAAQLAVERGGSPVEGLAETVKVEVRLGDQSTGPLDMRPVFGSPGEYRADLIPTAPGAYVLHFTGTIAGEAIDEEFVSGPDTFNEVQGTGEIAFPQQHPSNSELAQAIEMTRSDLSAVRETAGAASSAVDLARLLAVAGVALGAAGLIVALTRRTAR